MDKDVLKFDLSPNQLKYKDILNKEFIELEVWAISTINPNRNKSHFTLESLQDALPDCKNKPIVGFFENNDFTTHEGKADYDSEMKKEYWNTERGERILGWIRESDPVEIVEEKGLYWLKFRCILCTTYCYKQVKRLLKDKKKKVSVEITVKEHEIINGIEEIKKFVLNGVTILGSKNGKPVLEGIPGAHLSILENLDEDAMVEQKRALMFAYNQLDGVDCAGEDNIVVKDDLDLGEENTKKEVNQADMDNMNNTDNIETYGVNIKVDKSKEAMSDKPWGEVDKTELRNKVVKADNFKTVARDIFLDLREGWEDGEVSKLKYPVMEIKGDNTAVYNRGALASAKAYAEQHDEEEVLTKVKKIYEDLDLNDSEEEKEVACKMAAECKEDYCDECDCGETEKQSCETENVEEHCAAEDCGELVEHQETHVDDVTADVSVITEENGIVNENKPDLAMDNTDIDLGIPQCEEAPSAAEIHDGEEVLIDAEAPEALMPEGGIGVTVANDKGKAEITVIPDEDGVNKADVDIECKYNDLIRDFEDLKIRCNSFEKDLEEKDKIIAKYEDELKECADYADIKQRLTAAEEKLSAYHCAELKAVACKLMSEENIKKEYCDDIMAKCEKGGYTCEEDIKKDVAVAIYSSRPTREKRFSISVPIVETVTSKSNEKVTPASGIKKYINKE